jgi:hypothetical protein
MDNAPLIPEARGCSGNLQRAARVSGRDDVGFKRRDVARLPLAELRSRFRLDEIVDAGAAAADLRFRRAEKLDAGNRLQQLARLTADALRVRKVTRVVIDDASGNGMPRRSRWS